MANLKKVLAGSLSLCLAASMFTACGSTDSSSTSDKNGGSTSKAGDGKNPYSKQGRGTGKARC